MFHGRLARLATLWTGLWSIEFFGLLALHGLIKFGGSELADFMAEFFDLVPSQSDRWSLIAVGLGADHASEFLHFEEHLRREPRTPLLDCF